MGLLDQLWDDTLAGPTPDSGLGKLRKHPSLTSRSAAVKESSNGKRYEEGVVMSSSSSEDSVKVSRRIMIVKPPGGYQYGSPPVSPAASSTPPSSPFSGRESFRFRRRSTSDAYGKTTSEVGARTPTSPFDM
ncbi:dormancy-associated protein homolog 3 isoform X1 [Cucumis sativus]|uniref:Uncharacterized protein n=1 Tax=Cucumis sativus TaxID=3659 RepID=A0A0A0LWE4_CUCSA|nr:dormancy-associated protein homolog 3 isoform X1 [Cucumis sativus]KGN66063.1 hypothetical protein Csa_006915 [Cucumis sativus]